MNTKASAPTLAELATQVENLAAEVRAFLDTNPVLTSRLKNYTLQQLHGTADLLRGVVEDLGEAGPA